MRKLLSEFSNYSTNKCDKSYKKYHEYYNNYLFMNLIKETLSGELYEDILQLLKKRIPDVSHIKLGFEYGAIIWIYVTPNEQKEFYRTYHLMLYYCCNQYNKEILMKSFYISPLIIKNKLIGEAPFTYEIKSPFK
uniref:Uncharacterized protein n=1 Tax=viral metagenome TaxID=1070528 RepID=A0A6C0ABX3_9ZZZZ